MQHAAAPQPRPRTTTKDPLPLPHRDRARANDTADAISARDASEQTVPWNSVVANLLASRALAPRTGDGDNAHVSAVDKPAIPLRTIAADRALDQLGGALDFLAAVYSKRRYQTLPGHLSSTTTTTPRFPPDILSMCATVPTPTANSQTKTDRAAASLRSRPTHPSVSSSTLHSRQIQLVVFYASRYLLFSAIDGTPRAHTTLSPRSTLSRADAWHPASLTVSLSRLDDARSILRARFSEIDGQWWDLAIAKAQWAVGDLVAAQTWLRQAVGPLLLDLDASGAPAAASISRVLSTRALLSDWGLAAVSFKCHVEYLDRNTAALSETLAAWERAIHGALHVATPTPLPSDRDAITFLRHLVTAIALDDAGRHASARDHWFVIFPFAFRAPDLDLPSRSDLGTEATDSNGAESEVDLPDLLRKHDIRLWPIPAGLHEHCGLRLVHHLLATSVAQHAYDTLLEFVDLYDMPMAPFAFLLSSLAVCIGNVDAAAAFAATWARTLRLDDGWSTMWAPMLGACTVTEDDDHLFALGGQKIGAGLLEVQLLESAAMYLRDHGTLNGAVFQVTYLQTPAFLPHAMVAGGVDLMVKSTDVIVSAGTQLSFNRDHAFAFANLLVDWRAENNLHDLDDPVVLASLAVIRGTTRMLILWFDMVLVVETRRADSGSSVATTTTVVVEARPLAAIVADHCRITGPARGRPRLHITLERKHQWTDAIVSISGSYRHGTAAPAAAPGPGDGDSDADDDRQSTPFFLALNLAHPTAVLHPATTQPPLAAYHAAECLLDPPRNVFIDESTVKGPSASTALAVTHSWEQDVGTGKKRYKTHLYAIDRGTAAFTPIEVLVNLRLCLVRRGEWAIGVIAGARPQLVKLDPQSREVARAALPPLTPVHKRSSGGSGATLTDRTTSASTLTTDPSVAATPGSTRANAYAALYWHAVECVVFVTFNLVAVYDAKTLALVLQLEFDGANNPKHALIELNLSMPVQDDEYAVLACGRNVFVLHAPRSSPLDGMALVAYVPVPHLVNFLHLEYESEEGMRGADSGTASDERVGGVRAAAAASAARRVKWIHVLTYGSSHNHYLRFALEDALAEDVDGDSEDQGAGKPRLDKMMVLHGWSQYFPVRRGTTTYVQCKFNSESLVTDPVALSTDGKPVWDTELAWDLDARALHLLRTKRVPIKLTVFALSPQGARSVIGHLVLDLRSASTYPPRDEWRPLLVHSTPGGATGPKLATTGTRPEIKISFGAWPQGADQPQQAQAQQTRPPSAAVSRPVSTSRFAMLSPASSPPRLRPARTLTAPGRGSEPPSFLKDPTDFPLDGTFHHTTIAHLDGLDRHAISADITIGPDGRYHVGGGGGGGGGGTGAIGVSRETTADGDRSFRVAISLLGVRDLHLLSILPSAAKKGFATTSGTPDGDPSERAPDAEPVSTVQPEKGYFLLLRLLGNELRTQSFTDPHHPVFPPETLTLDLCTTTDKIVHFLRGIDRLPIYLCYDDKVLGSASFDILGLLRSRPDGGGGSDDDADEPDQTLPPDAIVEKLNRSQALDLDIYEEAAHGIKLTKRPTMAVLLSLTEIPSHVAPPTDAGAPMTDAALVPTHLPSAITELIHEHHARPHSQMQSSHDPPRAMPTNALPVSSTSPAHPAAAAALPPAAPTGPTAWHQYRFSIDIKAIRDLQGPYKSANVVFKYTYAPFGTRAPFISQPPVQILRGSGDVQLTTAFCAYEFVMAPPRLRVFLDAVPLEILAVHKDPFARDAWLGTALVHLSRVLDQPARKTETKSGQPLTAQVVDQWVNVMLPAQQAGAPTKVAEVRLVLCLEDFGAIEEQLGVTLPDAFANTITLPPSVTVGAIAPPIANGHDDVAHRARAATSPVVAASQPLPASGPAAAFPPSAPFTSAPASAAPPAPAAAHVPASSLPAPAPAGVPAPAPTVAPPAPIINEQLLWDAARHQIEEWKRRQVERIEAELRAREDHAMRELERTMRDREAAFERKVTEFRDLEAQLERLLADMERREQALEREEQAVFDRRVELEREFETKCSKVEEAARKLDADARHRMELDRARVAELERQKAALVKERDDWEAKYRRLDEAFFEFKNASLVASKGGPDVQDLQAQLRKTSDELAQAEKRVVLYRKQRAHFKQQWLKTLADFVQFKKDAEQHHQAFAATMPLQRRDGAGLSKTTSPIKGRTVAPAVVVDAVPASAAPPPPMPVSTAPASVSAAKDEQIAKAEEEMRVLRHQIEEIKAAQEAFQQSILVSSGSVLGPSAGVRASAAAFPTPTASGTDHGPPRASIPSQNLAQLELAVQERDLLLKSGVYTPHDELIRQLNARIDMLSKSA
ncbi:hypothetical protein GGF32_001327 [Allomyces javanicus]|nr:hypothetical protein GGF32_001327 [Allomyces javanicus]